MIQLGKHSMAGIAECQVCTVESDRKSPTKGSYSSLHVVIAKKVLAEFPRLLSVVSKSFLLFNIVYFSITRSFWSTRA